MANNQILKIKFIKPIETLEKFAATAWANMLPRLSIWIKTDLIKSFVYGGNGIKGIADMPFYKFISSPEGLSELGIAETEPPKLLEAYLKNAFSVQYRKRTLSLSFGDVAKLKMATHHPASGTGDLKIDSWLEWIVDDVPALKGYVPRSKVPAKTQKYIRLNAPLGGLMLKRGSFGSTGSWKFPQSLKDYDDDWFITNIGQIESVIGNKALELFARELNGQ